MFMPSADRLERLEAADLIRLIEGEQSAVVVLDGRGHTPLQVLDAADEGMPLQLMVLLHPGNREVPHLLEQLQAKVTTRPSCTVRVLATPWGERHHDLVMLTRGSAERNGRLQLIFGAGELRSETSPACHIAFVADDDLAYDAQVWFQDLWRAAAPLAAEVAATYPLWRRASAEPLAAEWESYRASLEALSRTERPDPMDVGLSDLDPACGGADGDNFPPHTAPAGGGALSSGSQDATPANGSVVGVRQPPALDREIRALYSRGHLVTVQLSERIPTFKLDVTEALGLSPRSKVGAASATSTIRLDLLSGTARGAVEKLRRKAGWILSRHSFLIDEGQHWMAQATEPFFVERLQSLKPINDISSLLGASLDEYLEQKMDPLTQELWEVLQSRKIEVDFDAETVRRLHAAVRSHLEDRAEIVVEPRHSREGLVFLGGEQSYARPFRLLSNIATTTRQRLVKECAEADHETEGPPLSTLDVVGGDGLVRRARNRELELLARQQLHKIKQVKAAGASEAGCWQLLQLLRGDAE